MVSKWNISKEVAGCEGCFDFCSWRCILGFSSRHQPDWLLTLCIETLQSLLTHIYRNVAYSKWIGTGNPEDLVAFKRARGKAKWAVREAKNRWFQEKVAAVEEGQFGGK